MTGQETHRAVPCTTSVDPARPLASDLTGISRKPRRELPSFPDDWEKQAARSPTSWGCGRRPHPGAAAGAGTKPAGLRASRLSCLQGRIESFCRKFGSSSDSSQAAISSQMSSPPLRGLYFSLIWSPKAKVRHRTPVNPNTEGGDRRISSPRPAWATGEPVLKQASQSNKYQVSE